LNREANPEYSKEGPCDLWEPEPKCKTCKDTKTRCGGAGQCDHDGTECFENVNCGEYEPILCPDCNKPEEVKPCPFCGSEAEHSNRRASSSCTNSDCFMSKHWVPDDQWNTRHDAGKE
jgi:hypothetical protein